MKKIWKKIIEKNEKNLFEKNDWILSNVCWGLTMYV